MDQPYPLLYCPVPEDGPGEPSAGPLAGPEQKKRVAKTVRTEPPDAQRPQPDLSVAAAMVMWRAMHGGC